MIKMKKLLNFFLFSIVGLLLLPACSIYKQQFDCPPPSGIPCASVTEIESMIIETEKGSDLIVKPAVEEENYCFWCGAQKTGSASLLKNSKCNRKVWICSQKKEGYLMKGHYFQKSDTAGFCQNIFLEPEDLFSGCINRKQEEE